MKIHFERGVRSPRAARAGRSLAVLGLAFAGAACAHDSSRELKTAEASLSSAQQSARDSMAELEKRQADERASVSARSQAAIAEAEEKRTTAIKAFDSARSDTKQASTDALANLDGRASDYRLRSNALDQDRKEQFRSLWDRYQTQRKDVQGQLSNLDGLSPSTWDTARDSLSDSLDGLGETVRRMGSLF